MPAPRFVHVVLAAAAFASIATSRLMPEVTVTEPLPAAVVDDGRPVQVYAIDLDRHGSSDAMLTGDLVVTLELRAAAGPPSGDAHLDVTLRAADGLEETAAIAVPAGTLGAPLQLQLPIWIACETRSPCRESLTLEIRRRDATDDAAVSVTGTLEANAISNDDAEPQITLEVTPL